MSPETERLHALWTKRLENMRPWKTFRAELGNALPGFVIGETGSTGDGGLRCMVYPPRASEPPASEWIVVGCVSLLAPVYFVHGVECEYVEGTLRRQSVSFERPPPGMTFPAEMVARTIEASLGYSAVSREVVDTPVPLFVGWRQPAEATLFHALFTSDPDIIP